jgi:UDP-glucose 4-epimerase
MKRQKVLITGGAGYIGSHVAHHWLEQSETAGTDIVIVDNLYSGHRRAVPAAAEFVEGDIGEAAFVKDLLKKNDFSAVLHFAAHTEVEESVKNPGKYYRNNTAATLGLIQSCLDSGIQNLIFSSTAAVYGEPKVSLISETEPVAPVNPYGSSKSMSERMLRDLALSSDGKLKYICLRYFNVAGARSDLKVGQATPRATHLIKVAAQVAAGVRESMTVFGTDYPTKDGTCLRDYIHVEDLANAHLKAWMHLQSGGASGLYNVGYGHPYSVREVIHTMSEVSGKPIKVIDGQRRLGDPSSVAAEASKIRRDLGWQPRFDNLAVICKSAYEFECLLASGKW